MRRKTTFKVTTLVLMTVWFVGSMLHSSFAANDDKRAIKRARGTSEARFALVVGNGDYKDAPLRNPVNDARDMAKQLERAGFQVRLLTNSSQRQMEKGIRTLGKELRGGGVGLFFFAGHGVQVDNVNYLMPIGADIETEADVRYEAVDANRILSQMEEAGNRMNLVFLDACRNNPFARSFRSARQGLAQMDNPSGSMVAFATAPGSVAADGSGRNGVFTKHLLAAIESPGLEIGRLMRQVRRNVQNETDGAQTPFELSSLVGDFYFISDDKGGTPVASPKPPKVTTASEEQELWTEVKGSGDVSQLQLYLDTYPSGRFATVAQLKISKLQKVVSKPVTASSSSQVLTDNYTDPITGMEFVLVKGGCYQMGNTFTKGDKDEKPVHKVCVDSFYMGKYEVTQGEYEIITGETPSRSKKGERNPVDRVSWDDAQEYIQELNNKSGKKFRLPTEAEWEYAARSGGKKEKYSGGARIDTVAWYDKNSGNKSHTVGTKEANGLGLFDMSGNVYEWCSDWYGKDYYGNSPQDNPQGPSEGDVRVFRGGSWGRYAVNALSANRQGGAPHDRSFVRGFRLVF